MTTKTRNRLRGFTLIELMVVVVIIGILASVGGAFYTSHLRQANVSTAIPYLMNIAAKNRIHYNRTGRYLASADEEEIQKKLGVDLSDAGDFCFMTICNSGTACGNYGASPFTTALASATNGTPVATGGSETIEFQVWAVLRRSTSLLGGDTVTGSSTTCTTSSVNPIKRPSSGWVNATTGIAGGVGRVVVLSYPPRTDGINNLSFNSHTFNMEWRSGVSISDPLFD